MKKSTTKKNAPERHPSHQVLQKTTHLHDLGHACRAPEIPEAALCGGIGRCSDLPSTRAGGQDDGSLNKLPQITPLHLTPPR